MYNQYPYINENDLNLDYLLKAIKQLKETMDAFIGANTLTFADPINWQITKQYPKNTIVLSNSGDAYLSKDIVPAGIQLADEDYWLEIFNFADYVRTANENLTVNVEQNTTRASQPYIVGDWLLWNDVLYKVIAAIAADDLLVENTNVEHFTVEDFIKAWITYANGLIVQYKNDIDASELAYRNQLAQDIASTTQSLQTQLNAVIAGATVDSEVIQARVDIYNVTHVNLYDALTSQFNLALMPRGNIAGAGVDFNNLNVGFCKVYNLISPQNAPVASPFGYVITSKDKYDEQGKTQLYIGYTVSEAYIRYCTNGNNWTAWNKFASGKNADDAYDNMIPRNNFVTGAGVDFDNFAPGYYRVFNLTSPSNAPVSNPMGLLVVLKDSINDNYYTQIYFAYKEKDSYIRYSGLNGYTEWHTLSPLIMGFRYNLAGSGIDFNSLRGGWCRIYNTTNPQNSPVENPFGLIITLIDNDDSTSLLRTQIYISYVDNEAYIRYCSGGGNWTDWQSLTNEYNHTITINSGDDLYTIIKNMPTKTHVIINAGTYDISAQVEALPDTNTYTTDMHIKAGCWIEGRGTPEIICNLSSKRTYTSPFFFDDGDGRISGIKLTATNTRYAIHDDKPNNVTKTPFSHIIEDCIISYTGIVGSDNTDGRAIGGGMGENVTNLVRNNLFISDTNTYPVSYHTSSAVLSNIPVTDASKVIIENNYFATGTVVMQALAADTTANRDYAIIRNNKLGNAPQLSDNTAHSIMMFVYNNDI